MTRCISLVALMIAVLVAGCSAQSKSLRRVKVFTSAATFGKNDTVGLGSTCDSSGNIYVSIVDPATHEVRPPLMFDGEGQLRVKFVSPHLHYLTSILLPFGLAPRGGLAVAERDSPNVRVVTFAADGEYESEVILSGPLFTPYQVAVFPSGTLLLSGSADGRKDRLFTAIYEKTGGFIKELILDGDAEIDRAVEIGDSRFAWSPGEGDRAISSGKAHVGDDGNVYLLRSTSPANVYVISPSGVVVRRLTVEPVTVGDMPLDMQLSKGRLAIGFDGWLGTRSAGTPTLVVVDAVSGERLQVFDKGIGIFGLARVSCYRADSGTFTYLGMTDSKQIETILASE